MSNCVSPVDIEADGIAGFGSMLSLGAQSPTGESFYSEIKPAFEEFIPDNKVFCENHNLPRERLLKETPDMKIVMLQFNQWIKSLQDRYQKSPIFTAFNAGFDFSFINLYFVKSGVDQNPFGISPFDLKSLAMCLSKSWNWEDTGKGKLPKVILPDEQFTHHALEDARYQQKLHFGLAGLIGDQGYWQIINRQI